MNHSYAKELQHRLPVQSSKGSDSPRSSLEETEIALYIVQEVMKHRRAPNFNASETCTAVPCARCISVHLPKVVAAVKKRTAVSFFLPAFPGKSPNSAKVFGPLPDHAERLALQFLEGLCSKVEEQYKPGMKIIICSDGRVFSDVVGMEEFDVTGYQAELKVMLQEMRAKNISTYNLDQAFSDLSFSEKRTELLKRFGKTIEDVRREVRNGAGTNSSIRERDSNRLYKGLTRFLFEDAVYPGGTTSRNKTQKEARTKAYEVMRRSDAWSTLIDNLFPDAVRLSIHPQDCVSQKLGIRLVGNDAWMTPWHGVAVETKDGFVLMKRHEAESLGAWIVYSQNGRPLYYKTADVTHLPK